MRKMGKIHYWVGVLAALLLFIQSSFGIYNYFQEQSMQRNFQANFSQGGNFPPQQGGNSNSSDGSGFAGQNGNSSNWGQDRPNRGQMNFNRPGMGDNNSFNSTLRKLQNNIIILIIMLVISGAGLVLSIMIGTNRKNKEAL